jgi:hypothetical protein
MIKHNPVIGTKRLRTKGDGHHTWTDDVVLGMPQIELAISAHMLWPDLGDVGAP